MPNKHVRLVPFHNWIVLFAIAHAGSMSLGVTCCATPPSSEKSPFVLIGDKRETPTKNHKVVDSALILNISEVGESKDSQAATKASAAELESTEFSRNSSRKTSSVSPERNVTDSGRELSPDWEAKTIGEVTNGKASVSEQLDSKISSDRVKVREQQVKDSGERLVESRDSVPDAATDDIPLSQAEHPFDAPAARSEGKDSFDSASAKPSGELTASQRELKRRINDCLSYYLQRPESVARRSPWAVMHATLPFGAEAELSTGNRNVNAIGWMCYNGVCKTQRLFQPTRTGFRANVGPGVQGHEGQFLAILAQSHISHTYPLRIGEKPFKIADLVRYEMATCREKSELTFKLIGLSYYLHPQQTWRDNQGRSWSLEKMVAEELEQPVVGAACGGTHRLMGFSFSLAQRRRAGLPMTGHWERAEKYVEDFVNYAISLQNPDGSFSTQWFESRANDSNMEKKVQTTGHILEWLIFTVSPEQLQSPPIVSAVNFILEQVSDNRAHEWPIGPRGHALRALTLYNQRVFGAANGDLKGFLARLNGQTTRR